MTASLAACLSEVDSGPNRDSTTPTDPGAFDGAEVWATQCASCHGDDAEGGVAPALAGWARGRDALIQVTEATMPLGSPETCGRACAEAVADFLLAAPVEPPLTCDAVVSPPRQVRLLTRREYLNTVRDLFAAAAPVLGAACTTLSDCDVRTESCEAGHCAADPCGRYTFDFDASGASPSAVVVAGSFNGWAARVEDGAWALEPLAGTGRWVLKRDLPAGRHSYKIVVDGADWRTDPNSPETEDDGFGGMNSVVQVQCDGGTPGEVPPLDDITAAFPVESRPEGYFYDNGAEAGLVSSVHLTEYMAAAERLADAALAAPTRSLGCSPSAPGCVREGLARLGARAFRRPLSADEVARYAGLVATESDVQDGLRIALRVMFAAPDFLYRVEAGAAVGDGTYRLSAYEIASAMSYLLWASAPDAALLEAAAAGRLDSSEGRAAEAQRMLADPRARAVVSDFVVQWLGADQVVGKEKRADAFPGFDSATKRALLEETRKFVEHVVFEGSGSLADLYVADYTYSNPSLAAFYGRSGGPEEGIVPLDGERAGVLGHASVLATYAHSDQTSPIQRGVFVRTRLLCQKFGIPPANAGGVPEVDPNATTRERFRQHSDDPVCASCHRYIDEVGFGFERFDAVGRFRETENGQTVDGSGQVEDLEGFGVGTNVTYETLPELARIIADSEASKACFATQYWRFALGRRERPADTCAIEKLTERFAAANFDVRALFVATVAADSFVTRQ